MKLVLLLLLLAVCDVEAGPGAAELRIVLSSTVAPELTVHFTVSRVPAGFAHPVSCTARMPGGRVQLRIELR